MKKTAICSMAITIVMIVLLGIAPAVFATSHEAEKAAPEATPAADESMQAVTEGDVSPGDYIFELAQPGPDIKRLDALAGNWNTKITVWPDGEEGEPFEIEGSAERKWILGGRYLEETTENATSDGVYQGKGFFGFNRAQALYEFVWISTEDIEVVFDRGRIDPESNALVLQGGYQDAVSGFYIFRTTEFVILTPDQHTMTVYLTDIDGRSYKSVEIVFTRK